MSHAHFSHCTAIRTGHGRLWATSLASRWGSSSGNLALPPNQHNTPTHKNDSCTPGRNSSAGLSVRMTIAAAPKTLNESARRPHA